MPVEETNMLEVNEKPNSMRHWTFDLLVLVLPLVGLLPMLVLQAMQLWSRSYAGFLPLAWLCLALLVAMSPKSMTTDKWRVLLFAVFYVLAFMAGIVSVIYFSPWSANLALAFIFISWAMIRLVPATITHIFALSTLIFVTLPLPLGLDRSLAIRGDEMIMKLCSPVLDVFSIFHLYESPVLSLKDHSFNIYDLLANSLNVQTMVAIAIVISLLWKRPLITTVLNVVSAGVWAMLGRLFFLFATAIFSVNEVNISQGYLGGLVLGVIALIVVLLIISSDAFWNAVLTPIRVGGESAYYRSASANFFNKIVVWPGRLITADELARSPKSAAPQPQFAIPISLVMPVGIIMAALMIPTVLAIVRNDLILNRANYFYVPPERMPDESTLADDFFARQRKRQFSSNANQGLAYSGAKTLIWSFSGSGVKTLVVLKFPVRGLIAAEYILGPGWNSEASKVKTDESQWAWSESDAKSLGGSSAFVLSAQMHTNGTPYKPTEDELSMAADPEAAEEQWSSMRILELLNPKQETLKPQTCCIQMLYQSEVEIKPAEKQLLTARFLEARKILMDKLLPSAAGANP